MKDLLQRQWLTGGWLSALLTPLSWLTGAVVSVKRTAYRKGWKQATRIDVPVIVVGNLYVGGTGKTPFLLATLDGLRARGWTPGVISRGYGAHPFEKGAAETPRTGRGVLNAALFGDEPTLIAREADVPVAVHPRRARAAQALRRDFPAVDVIVSDDGLQHLALARDVEVIVQDARGVGNGRLLPAGPLREPATRRDTVDVVVTNLTGTQTKGVTETGSGTGTDGGTARGIDTGMDHGNNRGDDPGMDHGNNPGITGQAAARAGANDLHAGPAAGRSNDAPFPVPSARGAPMPRQLTMRLVATHLRRVTDGDIRPLTWLTTADASRPHDSSSGTGAPAAPLRIGAAAGIGHPERFFATLNQAGIHPVVTRALPDHFDYATSPFSDMDVDLLLVTDKDAVKCGHLNDPRIWAVAVTAHLSDPTFFDWLDTRLHGHTPA